MASYSFHIRKADYPDQDGNFDLHVHVYKNDYRNRTLLGRYRLPTLEHVFPGEPELKQREIHELAGWLIKPEHGGRDGFTDMSSESCFIYSICYTDTTIFSA